MGKEQTTEKGGHEMTVQRNGPVRCAVQEGVD